MSAPLKICFFGFGSHARRGHFLYLLAHGNPFGIFDPYFSRNPEELDQIVNASKEEVLESVDPLHFNAMKQILNAVHVQLFATEEEALAWADAALICSPDAQHLRQAKAAVEAGCHVFCEKPLAATPQEYEELKSLLTQAENKGLSFTSCHPRRFDEPYIILRERLPNLVKAYGPVMELKLDFTYHTPSKDNLHGNSLLQDHANHEIDYLTWLLGFVPFKAYKLHDEADRYHLTGKREDGVVFTFSGTRRLDEETYPETIWVRFEKAEVFIDTYDEGNSYLLEHGTRNRMNFLCSTTDYALRFMYLNQHWLNQMAGKVQNYLTAPEMLLNTQMSVAFQQADSVTISAMPKLA